MVTQKQLDRLNSLPNLIQKILGMTIQGVIILRYNAEKQEVEYFYINDRAGEIVGKNSADYIGKSPGIHIHADDEQKAELAFIATFQGNCQDLELRIYTDEQTLKNVQVRMELIHEAAAEKFVLCLVTDITAQKNTIDELKKQTDMRRQYFEVAGHMFVALDDQGKIVDVNQKAVEILGYQVSEIIGLNWFEHFVPEPARKDVCAIFKSLMTGELANTEYFQNQILTSNGIRTISWRNSILRDTTGKITGTISSGEDISKSKFNEEILVQQHELITKLTALDSLDEAYKLTLSFLLKLTNMSGGGIYVRDNFGYLNLVHQQGLPEKFVAQTTSYAPDSPNSLLIEKGAAYYKTHQQLLSEMGVTKSQGTELKALAVIPMIVSGKVIGCFNLGSFSQTAFPEQLKAPIETVIGHASVIIARKQLRDQLQESKEKLSVILDSMPDMVYMASADGTILYANQVASAIMGIPLEKVGKIKIWDFLDAAGIELAKTNIEEAIRTGKSSRDVRYLLKIADGTLIPVEAHVTIWRNDDNLLLIGMVRDLREKVESEAEIARLQQGLIHSQKFEVLGTLAAGIAHDLNNILMVVYNYLELITMKTKEPEVKQMAQNCIKTSKSAADLIRRILPFARKSQPVKKPVDLESLIKSAWHVCRHSYSERISLQYKTMKESAVIEGDENQLLHSVIMNILNNARDAVANVENPAITISLSRKHLKRKDIPEIEKIDPGNFVIISIKDNGCGMDSETQALMFNHFYTTKPKDQGTGLGLATAREIVIAHGGMILCKSAPGQGTEFMIYLPQTSSEQSEEIVTDVTFPKAKGLILLVDDRPENLTLLSAQANLCGYETLQASTGIEALTIWHEKHAIIDLVIMDFDMPRKTGYRTLEEMYQIDPSVKCFMISGHSFEKKEMQLALNIFLKPELKDLWIEAKKVIEGKI